MFLFQEEYSLFGNFFLRLHQADHENRRGKKNPCFTILTGFVDKSCTYRFKHLCPEKGFLDVSEKVGMYTQQNKVCPSRVETLSPLL